MKVGGRSFDLTKADVEVRVKEMEPELIQKHVVKVNGRWYPPKQVLWKVTGWPRTSFTTLEAQRVLTRLGFECAERRGGGISQAGQIVVEAVRDSVHQAVSRQSAVGYERGFARAAGITLRRIQETLDGFREQMKGSGLSPCEQAVYAHLDELRSEIEAACDSYWQGSGVDWRPLRPVVKGRIRPPGEVEA